MLKYLQKAVNKMPEELVVLLKSLAEASKAANMPNVQGQIFFLRYICPALVQPGTLGGLEVITDDMSRSFLTLAKALQLIANKCDPKEGDAMLRPIQVCYLLPCMMSDAHLFV